MSIKYVKGDLLAAPQSFIVHQCNALGIMGSGVARQIKEQFPIVEGKYRDMCELTPRYHLLGMCQIVSIGDGRAIVNLIGQEKYLPRNVRNTSYDMLTRGFEQLKIETPYKDLAMPKIGCGLGGGNWKIVSAIIESIFDDRDVYIYEI